MESIQLFTQVITWTITIVIAVLFLVNLQNMIKAAAPENRAMKSGMVWIQLIPIVGGIYSFIVAKKVSDTITAEYNAKGQALPSPKPLYTIGLIFAVINIILNTYALYFNLKFKDAVDPNMSPEEITSVAMNSGMMAGSGMIVLLGLVWLVFFIIYWVQVAGYKNKLKTLPNNRNESEIFNHF